MSDTLVLVGSGPGIGRSIASLFAAKKFDSIALLSRNSARLSEDREIILGAAGREVQVETFAVDVSSPNLETTLEKVEKLGKISCVVFNAAIVAPNTLFEMEEEQMIKDYQIITIACYRTAKWAIPILSKNDGKFFVTSSLAAVDPVPQFFGLLMAKAAQRSLVKSIQKTYGEGIHIALISVNGLVSPDDMNLNPDLIAKVFWELWEQKKGEWSGEASVPKGSGGYFRQSIADN